MGGLTGFVIFSEVQSGTGVPRLTSQFRKAATGDPGRAVRGADGPWSRCLDPARRCDKPGRLGRRRDLSLPPAAGPRRVGRQRAYGPDTPVRPFGRARRQRIPAPTVDVVGYRNPAFDRRFDDRVPCAAPVKSGTAGCCRVAATNRNAAAIFFEHIPRPRLRGWAFSCTLSSSDG
jgi:hypothetical protein